MALEDGMGKFIAPKMSSCDKVVSPQSTDQHFRAELRIAHCFGSQVPKFFGCLSRCFI